MIDLLKKNGNFYKANLHCHSTISDGKMTPEQIKKYYKQHGYSIVAFTDHNQFVRHTDLADEGFLPVDGVEIDSGIIENGVRTRTVTCHINFYPKNPATAVLLQKPENYDIAAINKYILDMKNCGWLCTLNHPTWSLMPTEDVLAIDNLIGFEVYNNGCNKLYNKGDAQGSYLLYLASGKHAFAVAADDNHIGYENEEQQILLGGDDTLGGYVKISMPELSHSAFIDAFENGRFYASTGAEFNDLYIDEDTDELVINCSPVKSILVKGIQYINAARVHHNQDDITSYRFPLEQIRRACPDFFRVELMTTDGKRAYSQPYYFNKQ